jgi:hypothetical protein
MNNHETHIVHYPLSIVHYRNIHFKPIKIRVTDEKITVFSSIFLADV